MTKDEWKVVVGFIVLLAFLAFAGQGIGLWNLKFWGPKLESARRDIYDQSRTFQQGTVREIRRLCNEYNKAESTDHKVGFKQLAISEMDRLDQAGALVPSDLRRCFNE